MPFKRARQREPREGAVPDMNRKNDGGMRREPGAVPGAVPDMNRKNDGGMRRGSNGNSPEGLR